MGYVSGMEAINELDRQMRILETNIRALEGIAARLTNYAESLQHVPKAAASNAEKFSRSPRVTIRFSQRFLNYNW